MNEEKLMKMLEMYIPRCPTFNIPYKIEDFDIYKTMDPSGTLTTIEDLVKLEEPLYVSRCLEILHNFSSFLKIIFTFTNRLYFKYIY